MSIEGTIQNGQVVLDTPAPLPDGTKVTVTPAVEELPPIINPYTGKPYPSYIPREQAERMRRQDSGEEPDPDPDEMEARYKDIYGAVNNPDTPTDRAVNHDHYLYGHPKQQP